MEKIKYLFRKALESPDLVHIMPAISKVQKIAGREKLNSLDGLLLVAKAFSIEVRFVPEFPAKIHVSGYSDIDDKGQRYIFLSMNCSRTHLVHTLQHELGHHLLDHYSPTVDLTHRNPEFEAQIFAFILFLFGYKDQELLTRGHQENPEILLYTYLMGIGAVLLLAAGVIWELVGWVSNKRGAPEEGTNNRISA